MMVQKLLLKAIAKHFRLDEVLDYVFNPNQNNKDITEIKNRLKNVEALAHPQKEFVRCCQCQYKIEEKVC